MKKILILLVLAVAVQGEPLVKPQQKPADLLLSGSMPFQPVITVDIGEKLVIGRGEHKVTIDLVTGKVSYQGTPDQSAKEFWEAVGRALPLYRAE